MQKGKIMSSFTVSTELRPDRQMAVDIVVAQEVVERELRKAAKKVAGKYRIPGFRQGKAPYHIIVQQFGLANLYGEFVDDMGQQVFMEAIQQTGITPYAQATLADIKLEPLTYRLLVPLAPEVKLGDYRSLRIEQPGAEVDEALVDARIEQLREEYAAWTPADRPSQYGDTMTIDVRSVIPASAENEEEIVVLNETDWNVTPDQENPMEPAGFDEELIGLAAGDTKEFQLGWPADSQSVYAGKTATFTVTVKEIEAYDKPALDDNFAALVGPDFATLDDLKESIRTTIADEQAAAARNEYLTKVLDEVVAVSELNYPPVVIEDQIDAMVQDMDQQLRRYGLDGIDTYLKRTNQTLDDYRAELATQAETIARRNLVLSELVLAEQLTVTPEELAERATRIARQDYDEPQADEVDAETAALHQEQVDKLVAFFSTGDGRTMLVNQMMTEKALDRIMAIARGEDVPALAVAVNDEAADEGAAPAPDAAA
jgi:trigger factor